MTREDRIHGQPVLVLSDPKPIPPPAHECAVHYGCSASIKDNGAIIQCECGKRYKCRARRGLTIEEGYVWVRRILPWPPRQKGWPSNA